MITIKDFIVTNNPLVRDEFDNIVFVQGSYHDVLVKVRDFVHSGHELINHPLGASIRMLFSPYRSIFMGDKTNTHNEYFIETVENSIENYNKHMEVRKPDTDNSSDYAIIDKELLISAMKEYKSLKQL